MRKKFFLIAFFIICVIALNAQIISGQKSEYYPAKTILMHVPGEELFLGIVHPNAALFDVYFDCDKAAAEHQGYQRALTDKGITVLTVKDVLMKGCMDQDKAIADDAIKQLRNFASSHLVYNLSHLPEAMRHNQNVVKEKVLSQASPQDLVRIIMLNPTVTLYATDNNTGLRAEYSEAPIMNLYFTRDQSITTANGTVICKMNSEQRQKECDILKLCYSKLGISPIWNVTGDGAYLEGGDFIPFGNKAFIGTGMRTTQVAVDQMMANDVFGTDSVIVVKDTWHYQPQMHLDTYFNIIDRDLATMTEMRANASIGDKKRSLADVYVRNKKTKKYKRIISDMDFVKYITKIEKMKIILISDADQNNYANNFLTIGPREIMSVAGQSEALQQTYKENRVKVTWIPLNNLTKGYGAAHCMTQVIQRENRMDK